MAVTLLKNCISHSKVVLGSKSLLRTLMTRSLVSVDNINTGIISRSSFSLNRNGSLGSFASRTMLYNINNCRYLQTKGDQELVAYLEGEIKNEKARQEHMPKLDDFECTLTGSEVELRKKLNGEMIIINANINGSVDAEDTTMDPNEADKEPSEEAETEMKSKPDFTVSIVKGNKTLWFECSYSHEVSEEETEAFSDSFQISELSLFENEMTDSTYTVSGEIMDGYLYDLLMNYLEDRGISNDFVDKMIAFFTGYEQQLYIKHLEGLKSFIERKV